MKNRHMLLVFFLVLFSASVMSQNKIGDNPTIIQPGSLLELESATKGVRLPRIVLNDVNLWTLDGTAISGMVIVNEAGSAPKGIYYWSTDLTQWVRVLNKSELSSLVANYLTQNTSVKDSLVKSVVNNIPATATSKGVIQLAGDLGGTAIAPTVSKLQGTAVSGTAPINGQVLTFDGTSWIPTTSSGAVTSVAGKTGVVTLTAADVSGLSTVASSGSYTDLSNQPTIPAAQVQSDWNATSGMGQVLNKPTLSTVATTGDYTDLLNKPTIPAATTIVNDLTTGGSTAALSAEMGKTLNTNISAETSRATTAEATKIAKVDAFTGDVTGMYDATKVAKIQGVDVAATAPTANQVLTYNNTTSKWEPAATMTTTVEDVLTSTSATNALSANQGKVLNDGLTAETTRATTVEATKIAKVDAFTGDVTGTYDATKVAKIQGVDVAATAPTANQVLTYNSTTSKWEPAAMAATTNTLVNDGSNTLTSTVNGVVATSNIVNNTTVTISGGKIHIGANGIISSDTNIDNALSSSTNTLSSTVAGGTAQTATIINSNDLGAASDAITSTVNGVASTLTPVAGTIANNLGFDVTGALVKQAPAASNATGFLSPVAIYQAASGSSVFPASSVAYPGDGNLTFNENEAVRLIYTVTGARAGYTVHATAATGFDDKIIIAKTKVVADNTVEVVAVNGTADTVIPSTLQMTFSYIKQ